MAPAIRDRLFRVLGLLQWLHTNLAFLLPICNGANDHADMVIGNLQLGQRVAMRFMAPNA